MAVDALPKRPLSHAEVRVLGASGSFVDVRPVNTFLFPERDTTLVTSLVLVTDSGLRAVDYDPAAREWQVVRTEPLDSPESAEDVPDELLTDVQSELEQRAQELEEAGVVSETPEPNEDVQVREASNLGSLLYEQYTNEPEN
ncbi:hypothetical protein [Halospeciosus flavus]|uniref:DUF7964 domain-containing protein n=1 Tax=Halospeciosus flavus TaxID=3032283 RepID=A0ABD5Z5F9_9EURY|nr:hypothetical protein [Halospeciosus flavus]